MAKRKDKYMNNNDSLPIQVFIDYTPEQLVELDKCQNDIFYFAEKYFHIVNLDKGKMPIELYPAQRDAIQAVLDNKMTIICASRQVGKSTLMTIICLWYALFNENYQIAILANKEEQAKEILDRIKLGYEEIPVWLKSGVPTYTNENIVFGNRSKIFIQATSESGIRGKSVNLLFVDEFAHLQSQIIDPFVKSIMPTISSSKSAKIVLVSTPKGAQGKFYEYWEGAQREGRDDWNQWKAVKIHYSDVPGRDEKWIAES
ncbi:MAG TPA: terminase large subunit, partial [Candidatus Dojkabacteria bacterium]|nr:terminase large subunit [Candidatus Dojkabacteria bacterium]